jgi:hypothetical protein
MILQPGDRVRPLQTRMDGPGAPTHFGPSARGQILKIESLPGAVTVAQILWDDGAIGFSLITKLERE